MTTLFAEQPNMLPPMKSNEWYTPSKYVEAAREVMGGIDLDPASCELANETVKATRFYTKKMNGLLQSWQSRSIWLNPPYGRVNDSGASVIRMFVTKLIDEYKARSFEQAILLTTVQTNSTWFQLLWDYPICFTSHRVAFIKPAYGMKADGRTSHTLGTALVYLGSNEAAFIEHFSPFGRIAKAIDTPKVQPATLPLWEVQS
jgi:phage N-6-adenine-methyltransferase